jgi:hypothetical protein
VNRFPATVCVADLGLELQRIYDSEINVRISWLWDGGVEVHLGDKVNGFLVEETVRSVSEIVPLLEEAIAHFFPASSYAQSLSPEVRKRATNRLFHAPKTAASVICPHCGAPHALPPGMGELFQFIGARCGQCVIVEPLGFSGRKLEERCAGITRISIRPKNRPIRCGSAGGASSASACAGDAATALRRSRCNASGASRCCPFRRPGAGNASQAGATTPHSTWVTRWSPHECFFVGP